MEATAMDTARSLYLVYRQLPTDVQQAFKDLLEKEAVDYRNAEWLPLSDPTLNDIWGLPEENYWDELYAKQHPDR